jgi:hypothetical protein
MSRRHTDQRLKKRLGEVFDRMVQERTYDFARFGLAVEGEALRVLPGLPPTLALPITMPYWRPGYVLYPAATWAHLTAWDIKHRADTDEQACDHRLKMAFLRPAMEPDPSMRVHEACQRLAARD